MGKQPKAVDIYLKKTRTCFFGLLAITPLLILYESASEYLHRQPAESVVAAPEVRNSAEILIKRVLWFAQIRNNIYLWAVFAAVLALAFWQAKKQGNIDFKFVYFPYQIFESLVYALVFGFAVSKLAVYLKLQSNGQGQNELSAKMTLALGAGIYEELLFRFLLVSLLALLFRKVLTPKAIYHNLLAVIIAAVIFSLYHYWNNTEVLNSDSFLFRFYAGCILGALYVLRGIGVTVYTHAFYDLLLLFRG
jgi:membrane protease YdiL (CAAX protease family)